MIAFFALLVIGVFESYLGFTISVVLYIQCAMMVVLWRLHLRERAASNGIQAQPAFSRSAAAKTG